MGSHITNIICALLYLILELFFNVALMKVFFSPKHVIIPEYNNLGVFDGNMMIRCKFITTGDVFRKIKIHTCVDTSVSRWLASGLGGVGGDAW